MKQRLISIIIPSYNEGNNVKLIHESLKKEFQTIHYDYEIFYINDGSADDTLQQLKNWPPETIASNTYLFPATSGKKRPFWQDLNTCRAKR